MNNPEMHRYVVFQDAPICADCRHYFINTECESTKIPRCQKTKGRHLIYGNEVMMLCQDARELVDYCGLSGKWWEAK